MTQVQDASIAEQLLDIEPVKTWSLIATIFGDLARESVSGKELKALLEPLGIKPEAMRVALHRLKKDGWIVSQKTGREVSYQLSEQGRTETVAARKDVYRTTVKYPQGWSMILLPTESVTLVIPHVAIEKGTFLVPADAPLPEGAMSLMLTARIPDWFERHLVPDHMRVQAQLLSHLAAEFQVNAADPVDAARARLMFVHLWRKMALRLGTWAHMAVFPDGIMAQCHAAMITVFAQTEHARP